jgi:hypothetical protein
MVQTKRVRPRNAKIRIVLCDKTIAGSRSLQLPPVSNSARNNGIREDWPVYDRRGGLFEGFQRRR